VETVVCLNRCTDATESIARARGATVVHEDARNLSKIRNAAARAARGDTFVTIDADSRMSPGMLAEIRRRLDSGKVVGGGVARVYPERWSLGIVCTGLLVAPFVFRHRVTCGLFWTRAQDFRAIGGFNEGLVSVEDVDFAVRLKRHGKAQGQRFGHIWREHLTTSCRKFDWFGDWFLFRHPSILRRALKGDDKEVANRVWYEARRK
jgi:glycosyltransferase involved in cell wall biosynthesis